MTMKIRSPYGAQFGEVKCVFGVHEAGVANQTETEQDRLGSFEIRTRPMSNAGDPPPRTGLTHVACLAKDVWLDDDFSHLPECTSPWTLKRVAAAASAQIPGREGDGFRLRFEKSRAETDQIYVILEILGESVPEAVIIVLGDGRAITKMLPEPVDGIIQILAEQTSELITALSAPDSKVYLK
jgi:hypothetical protein